MKIIAHELNNKKYKGFLNALGLVNSVEVWDSNNKSIYDMRVEKEPDIVLIPSSVMKERPYLDDPYPEGKDIYILDLDSMPICANIFPKGSHNNAYFSDILILPDSLEHIYTFSSLLYPNQNELRVKVISSVPFPIAEYIGYGNAQTIADYIASTRLVICTDKQTEVNMWGIPNLHCLNVVEKDVSLIKSFFEYYSNFDQYSTWYTERTDNHDKVKNGLTYYNECIKFYEELKKDWYKELPFDRMIKLTKEKI